MGFKFNLIVDSCCDLSSSYFGEEGVEVLNFTYNLDGVDHVDDFFETLSPHDFYENMRFGASPTTSQVTPVHLREMMEKFADSELPTLFLCFSSGLSGTYNGAVLVADALREEYPDFDLRVVDTKLASVAEGSLVNEILKVRRAGATIDEALAATAEIRRNHTCLFMVDDLEALSRGGRIPSTVASVGSVLDVKPMLSIGDDGKLTMCGVSRGRKKGIKSLCNHVAKNRGDEGQEKVTIYVAHSDCPDDAEKLKELVCKTAPKAKVLIANIGPVIGSHVGPDMLAVSFVKPSAAQMKVM